jgi:hypothetical protein
MKIKYFCVFIWNMSNELSTIIHVLFVLLILVEFFPIGSTFNEYYDPFNDQKGQEANWPLFALSKT